MRSVMANGRQRTVGRELGSGGEGDVFALADRTDEAVKLYKPALRGQREAKVRAMVGARLADSTDLVAFPTSIATDPGGAFLGFVMRLVAGYRPVHELYSPKSRRTAFPTADYRFLVRAAANVARAVAKVHAAGCVIGDFNHSGVLVAQDMTVALIDADSFQFSVAGTRFACVVGVPDFTPPELHGADLSRVERTRSHDAFGLAVAVFHILAMGRHPYAGRFAGGDLTMAEAIAQNRFAFSDERRDQTRTTPPPASLTLRDLPRPVAAAFEAAFGTHPDARPDAASWVVLLKELEAGLSHCARVRSHYYPSAAGGCTWCRILEKSGVDMFPDLGVGAAKTPTGAPFDLASFRTQLAAIRLPEAASLLPTAPPPGAEASASVSEAKRALSGRKALGVVALVGAAAGFGYASALAVVWIGLGIFGLMKLFGGQVEAAPFRRAYEQADQRARASEMAFLQRIGFAELTAVRDDLARWLDAYGELDTDTARQLAELRSTREKRQRDAFLDRFPIRRAAIAGIGPAKKATLASYGIETAADTTAQAVRAVPGFGEATTAKMLAWRRGHEAKFRYNPAPDASDVQAENAVRSAAAARRGDLQARIRSGMAALQTGPQTLTSSARQVDAALTRALQERQEAARDLRLLGQPVPPSKPLVAIGAVRSPAAPRAAPAPTARPAAQASAAAGAAPTCPQCGGAMRRRTARRGSRAGRQFWGCARYPACRGTRN